ncbi:MAG: DUF1540 domain-containing protein [Clostridia bacterium]|nr:DUF1540 domain-containing protein [Clostridia bacterium]
MNDNNINKSIHCSVYSCAYNNREQGYCKLDSIKVGTHESNPTEKKCTDCESFMLGNCGSSTCG